MRIALTSLTFCLVVTSAAFAQRLPTNVTPEHYDLWFAPDLEKETFRGRETITVSIAAPTSAITLNAAEITFGEVTIDSGGKTQTAKVTLNEKDDTATFTVPAALAKGTAKIHITYTGILNGQLRGFYLSKANGRKYAVSQMEATDARRAFPCFDEPAFKATFAITLMVDAADTAISNGKQVSDSPGPEPGKHTVVFAPTPKMSSYLVALLVGDFVCRSGSSGITPVRVCATPDKQSLTAFALTAAEYEVKFFNDYFKIPYPYEKLDIIGIPDFAAGAMENAGAITFRERVLLVDESNASVATRKTVASVIAHELAHQWFGDLVTMKWWDDIWLNEGFATWAANKPLAAWKPEWNLEVTASQQQQIAVGLDVLQSTRAIHTQVSTPAEINEVFDPIAYEKTGSVLRMVENFVGPEKFRGGVSSYLTKYSLGNAAGEDFWNEVTRVTEKPVNRIMKSFVDQPGAPLLSARTKCVNGSTEVSIEQSRFIGTPERPHTLVPQHWTLPVCVKTAGNAGSCTVVTEASQTIRVPGCGGAMINAGGVGYYLTEYEPAALMELARRNPPLTAPERISLLGDEWRMARSGRHDIGHYLDLAAAFAPDRTPEVAAEIAGRLNAVRSDIADANQRPAFDAWIRKQFRPALDAIGIAPKSGDGDDINSLRGTLLLVLSSDPAVQKSAREMVERYLEQPTSLPPTLAASVIIVAAIGGDAALYDRYLAQMNASVANPEEFYRFFSALAVFPTPALRARTIEFALSDQVRTQDTPLLLSQLLASAGSQDATWEYLTSHWDVVTRKVGGFLGMPAIAGSLSGYCSAAKSAEIKAFFDAHPAPDAARTLQQTYERIATCVAVDARQSPSFTKWLAAQ